MSQMDAYTSFAEVYDMFMDNIPYAVWCQYLVALLQEYGVPNGLVLDLGCGTGTLTRMLALRGYDMIGVDISEGMLEIAVQRSHETGPESEILYLLQDMRELELYGTVRAVVSICDCMNYLMEYEDLVQVFSQVNNYLDPGGVFIFDLNTIYKYEQELGDKTIAENRDEGSFIWENYYDEEEQVNEYDLTFFIRESDGRYQKFEETHYQRAYSLESIKQALAAAGMEFVAAYDAFGKNAPREDSERIYIIAREHGKERASMCAGIVDSEDSRM